MSPTGTSPGARTVNESDTEHAAWTVAALRTVWEHQQDRVSDRIDVIEQAIVALADDRLDTDLRADAERAAHMLAGSLGMFGFIGASGAAHELEAELARPTADGMPALSVLLRSLRSGIQGPVTLSTAPLNLGSSPGA